MTMRNLGMMEKPSLYQQIARVLGVQAPKPVGINSEAWVVQNTNWSPKLSANEMKIMGTICPPRPYRKSEFIYRHGDTADTLFILLEGHVKVALPNERVVAICGPDDFFGESFLTNHASRLSDAICLSEKVIACPISREQFLSVAQAVPNVALAFATVLSERNRTLELELQRTSLPAEARLAASLVLLAKRFGTQVSTDLYDLNLDLRQEELGALAGTTRVSATTAMSAWREQGWILGTRGSYRINTKALELQIERLEAVKHGR
jgi:CRP/FNR family transcriptional regulator, cyclic AMP receptor protein